MSNRTREYRFDLWLDDSEEKLFAIIARKYGMTKSGFIRHIVRRGRMPPLPRVRARA